MPRSHVNSNLVLNKFLEWSSRNRASMQQSQRVQIAWHVASVNGVNKGIWDDSSLNLLSFKHKVYVALT